MEIPGLPVMVTLNVAIDNSVRSGSRIHCVIANTEPGASVCAHRAAEFA